MVATTIKRPRTHRDSLLAAGTRLFFDVGYNGTTVDAVLETAGVPKGSFYHHFGSKRAFGSAVLDRYLSAQLELVRSWSERHDLGADAQVIGYHRQLIDMFIRSDFSWPCLAGKLSNELSATDDEFREQLDTGFRSWHAALSAMLAAGQQRGEVSSDVTADDLSHAVLALIEGGFVAALSLREPSHLDVVNQGLADIMGRR